MNNVILVGHICGNGNFQQVNNNTVDSYTNTIAVKRSFKNSKGEYDSDFIDFVAWQSTATFLNNYVRKGSMVLLGGELRLNKYKDKNGDEMKKLQVVVEKVEILKNPEQKEEEKPVTTNEKEFEVSEQDLPF